MQLRFDNLSVKLLRTHNLTFNLLKTNKLQFKMADSLTLSHLLLFHKFKLFKANNLIYLLINGPSHGSHKCSAKHTRYHAFEVTSDAILAVNIHCHRPDTIEFVGIKLHLGL